MSQFGPFQLRSPCLDCERRDQDKSECADRCERRAKWLETEGLLSSTDTKHLEGVKMERNHEGRAEKPDAIALARPTEEPKPIKICKVPHCDNEAKPNGYCASCFGRIGAQGLKAKLEAAQMTEKPAEKPSGETASKNTVKISFEGYESVLKALQEMAREQVRTVAEQIVFLVKEAVD